MGRGDEDAYRYVAQGSARERLPAEQADYPETCELCGVLVADGSRLYGLVMDSSVIHASDPAMDGSRLITACSDEHLTALQARYAARPFVHEEQWAGKLIRALPDAGPAEPGDLQPPVDLARLQQTAGLDLEQIRRALSWLDQQPPPGPAGD